MAEEGKAGQMQQSTANVLKLELMDKCNCRRGFEVLYFCKDKKCSDNQNQKYYCLECSYEDGKHDHKSIPIVKEIETQHTKWYDLKANVQKLFN